MNNLFEPPNPYELAFRYFEKRLKELEVARHYKTTLDVFSIGDRVRPTIPHLENFTGTVEAKKMMYNSPWIKVKIVNAPENTEYLPLWYAPEEIVKV